MMSKNEIIEEMRKMGKASPPYLQRKLKISYKEAKEICDGLVFDKKESKYIISMNNYLEKFR